jgi:hypothetical protein
VLTAPAQPRRQLRAQHDREHLLGLVAIQLQELGYRNMASASAPKFSTAPKCLVFAVISVATGEKVLVSCFIWAITIFIGFSRKVD